MAAGAALLGPVGWVAGNMIGGSAAKSSMAALTGDPKKKSDAEKTDSHHPGGEDLSSPSRSNAAATQHTPGSNQHQLTQSQQLSTPQRPSHSHTTAPPLAQPANIPNSTQQGYRFGKNMGSENVLLVVVGISNLIISHQRRYHERDRCEGEESRRKR